MSFLGIKIRVDNVENLKTVLRILTREGYRDCVVDRKQDGHLIYPRDVYATQNGSIVDKSWGEAFYTSGEMMCFIDADKDTLVDLAGTDVFARLPLPVEVPDEGQFRDMKVVVPEGMVEAYQTYFFGLGYRWKTGKTRQPGSYIRYLFTTKDGFLEFGEKNGTQFHNDPATRIELKEVRTFEIVDPEQIEIDGKKYVKADVLERLKYLNPIEKEPQI